MQFLSMREFSKTPKTALSRLASEGKAVLTSNGKPAALMINVDAENFETVFGIVQEAERRMSGVRVYGNAASDKEREAALERLMNFPRAELPPDFDYKKEKLGAIDERFNRID
jgi:hypothetical protein